MSLQNLYSTRSNQNDRFIPHTASIYRLKDYMSKKAATICHVPVSLTSAKAASISPKSSRHNQKQCFRRAHEHQTSRTTTTQYVRQLLRGSWDLVVTYKWAIITRRIVSLTGLIKLSPSISMVISPVTSSY